jgi:cardiolipin synthase
VRKLAERALSRAAGAPLIGGNAIDLLIDAEANYAAWLGAIATARQRILLENYIIRDDRVGCAFRDALIERARAGVEVCVVYDWLGCLGQSCSAFWQPLRDAGADVRVYNPFQMHNPFGWISRDHRKMLLVDHEVGFLGGLCISARWLGDAARNIAPWRDSAVRLRGPALPECESAFAAVWNQLGTPLAELSAPAPAPCGDVDLRVIGTQPDTASVFRLDQLVAGLAQRSLWLADAYFVGVAPYVQALIAAARDGVDVRLLVPGSSDLPLVRNMSLSGYRPLLHAGIRVYEWNGSMMHAKTAVADGRWARVGSSNLNISSWVGNCELDVAVEDVGFATRMEQQYLADLEQSTELLLTGRPRRHPTGARVARKGRGSSSRAAAGALRLAHSVGGALGGHRVLGPATRAPSPWSIASLLGAAVVAAFWPRVITWPLAVFLLWIALGLIVRAVQARRLGERVPGEPAGAAAAPPQDPH